MHRVERSALSSGILPVFVLFLISGATGLAYEVVWTRMLVRIFGASSFAVSTVLAAYMAGFALGSYLLGRLIDRKGNPVLIYGLLELGIGAFALAMPLLLAGLNPLYRSLYGSLEGKLYALSLVRFLLSFTLLLIPTTLMGGTLPVLSRFVTRSLSNLAFRVGWLYSINTFGAVVGTFVTGFVLLPHLGMRTTTVAAASANLAIFAVAMALSRRG
ncbi:MAG: fused MFS/spermidine synthase, partial [bacterium]